MPASRDSWVGPSRRAFKKAGSLNRGVAVGDLWGFELRAGPIGTLAACREAVRATPTDRLVAGETRLEPRFWSLRGWPRLLAQ
jgi:hypothetical protein